MFYNTNIKIEIISEEINNGFANGVFQLTFKNEGYSLSESKISVKSNTVDTNKYPYLKSDIFFDLFPFHVIFKKDLKIASMGEALKSAINEYNDEYMTSVFNLEKPIIDFTWENVCISFLH